jgi:hypothetical protein
LSGGGDRIRRKVLAAHAYDPASLHNLIYEQGSEPTILAHHRKHQHYGIADLQ